MTVGYPQRWRKRYGLTKAALDCGMNRSVYLTTAYRTQLENARCRARKEVVWRSSCSLNQSLDGYVDHAAFRPSPMFIDTECLALVENIPKRHEAQLSSSRS